MQTISGGLQLRTANIFRAVQDLPLQVALIHHIEIHNTNAAHASRCQIQRERRAQSASP